MPLPWLYTESTFSKVNFQTDSVSKHAHTRKLHLLEEMNGTRWTFLAFVNKTASCNFQHQFYLGPVYLSNFKPLNLRNDYIFFKYKGFLSLVRLLF